MRNYGVTRNIRSEIKLNGAIALKDVAIYAVIGVLALLLSHVFPPTEMPSKIAFLIVMTIFAIWLTMKPNSNPNKRNYQIMFFMLKKKQHFFRSLDENYDENLIPNLRISDAGKVHKNRYFNDN